MRDDEVELEGEVKAETEKAYRFGMGTILVWLPKSHCKWDQDAKTMKVPEWLAYERELI